MADLAITDLTNTISSLTGASNMFVGVDNLNGTPESQQVAISTLLDSADHTVDPTGLTYITTTNVQAALIEIDTAIVGEKTIIQADGTPVSDDGPTLNFTTDFDLAESPTDTFAITLADNSVDTAELVNAGVTNGKLADMAAYTIKARNAGTTGAPGDVTIQGLTEKATPVDGDWILIADSAASNAFKKVNLSNITPVATVVNADLADMAAYTLKGRNAGTTGVPSDIAIASLTEKTALVSGDWVLLADSEASNAFKKAGIGSLGATSKAFQSLTAAANVTNNVAVSVNARLDPTEATQNIDMLTAVTDGMEGVLIIRGSSNEITWDAEWDFVGGVAPSLTTNTSSALMISWIYDASADSAAGKIHALDQQEFVW